MNNLELDTGETGSDESEEVPDSGDAKKETGEAEDAGISGNGTKYITIAFDAMGGTSDKQSMRAEAGTTYGKLPEAAKNGYVFSGWYTAPDSGSRITAASKVPVTTDQTLYARWEYIEIAVKQKYDVTEYFISEMNNANTNTSAVNGMDDIKGYLILEGKGKASVSGKGILTARKAGEVVIVPYMKQGKKKVPVEGIRPLHLIIRKPCASGKLILTSPGQMAELNDYLTNLPGNSNSIRWTVRTGRNPVIT